MGSSCLIAIKFAPTAVGLATGTLSVVDNAEGSPQSAALTGTGVAAVPILMLSGPTFVNNTLTYGSQVLATTSPAQTLVVTNSGAATLSVSTVAVTTDFTIAGGSCGTAAFNLDPGASCELTVTFTPSATGTRTGTLTLIHNAAGSPAVVALTGTGISAGVGLSPSTIAFGTQVVGTTSGPQSTTLTNTGAAPLSVTALTASGDFALSSPDCATLPVTLQPNGVCTLVVTFSPTAAGVRTGTVTITDGLGQQFASLTGDGAAPGVQLTPANLDFGSQTVGTTSAEQTVTLTNTGTSSLQVNSFIAAGDFAMTSPDCATLPVVLAPGQVCTLELNFTPTATGIRTGFLGVTTSASAGQQFVVLEGIGNAPGLTLSPSNLDFGSQLVSTASPAQTITSNQLGHQLSGGQHVQRQRRLCRIELRLPHLARDLGALHRNMHSGGDLHACGRRQAHGHPYGNKHGVGGPGVRGPGWIRHSPGSGRSCSWAGKLVVWQPGRGRHEHAAGGGGDQQRGRAP